MTLGERCDEIVRLIDETLEDYALHAPCLAPAAPAVQVAVEEPPMVRRVRALAQLQRDRLARSA